MRFRDAFFRSEPVDYHLGRRNTRANVLVTTQNILVTA